ncbi:MAG: hypothetical protein Q9165_008371 [Trypethelium subeluteriae]
MALPITFYASTVAYMVGILSLTNYHSFSTRAVLLIVIATSNAIAVANAKNFTTDVINNWWWSLLSIQQTVYMGFLYRLDRTNLVIPEHLPYPQRVLHAWAIFWNYRGIGTPWQVSYIPPERLLGFQVERPATRRRFLKIRTINFLVIFLALCIWIDPLLQPKFRPEDFAVDKEPFFRRINKVTLHELIFRIWITLQHLIPAWLTFCLVHTSISIFAILLGGRPEDWPPLFGSIFEAYSVRRYWSLIARLDPEAGAKQEAEQKAKAAARRLDGILARDERTDEDGEYRGTSRGRLRDRPRKEDLMLSPYEQTIAMEVVAPDEIPISFDDIGGMDDIIEELKESVIYPLTLPHLYTSSSSLLSAPSGVLLYGPPGCGKTMLAKALAHESGACFINLHISTLTEKWYGDSNKLVSAVFSLARKLQPSIVFIDEIDAVLGQRRSNEHEASGMVKAEFMTHWDGLTSTNSLGTPQRICILGATNRPQDIDDAILRRLPKKFAVPLPSAPQRRRIFALILKDTRLAPAGHSAQNFDLDALVKMSAGMSGSDIKEACRDAAMMPVREMIRRRRESGVPVGGRRGRRGGSGWRGEDEDEEEEEEEVRGLRTSDFLGRKGGVGLRLGNQVEPEDDGFDTKRRTSNADESGNETEEVSGSEDGNGWSNGFEDAKARVE